MNTLTTSSLRALILSIGATLSAAGVHAQAFDAVRLNGAAPGKNGGISGSAVLLGTEYAGSDERRTLVLPVLDYQWANGWFAGTSNGIGYNFSRRQGTQFGLRLTADFGRKERRSPALRGLGDIDAKAEFGGFFNHALTPRLSLTSSLRYGSGRQGRGLVADLGAAYATPIAADWRLGVGAGISLANAEAQQSSFGITAAQSTASGYRVYTPKAGLQGGRVNLSLTYSATSRVSVTAGVSATTLRGDAADSPLVRKKSTVNGLLAAAYAF